MKYLIIICFQQNTTDEEVDTYKSVFNDSVESSKHYYAASNYLDAAATSTLNVVTSSNYSDLPSQLASLGLEKYTREFSYKYNPNEALEIYVLTFASVCLVCIQIRYFLILPVCTGNGVIQNV